MNFSTFCKQFDPPIEENELRNLLISFRNKRREIEQLRHDYCSVGRDIGFDLELAEFIEENLDENISDNDFLQTYVDWRTEDGTF